MLMVARNLSRFVEELDERIKVLEEKLGGDKDG